MPNVTRDQAYANQRAATQAERTAAYEEGLAAWHAQNDEPDTSHLTPAAIAACTLCDEDGYTPAGRICDHRDRTATHARGIAAVRAALAKGPTP